METTFSIIASWFNTYGIIPIISAFLGIITSYLKLRNNVDNLKCDLNRLRKEFEEHPIILLFKNWERSEGAYIFFNSILKNSRIEKTRKRKRNFLLFRRIYSSESVILEISYTEIIKPARTIMTM
jgi:hypothetical protein